MAASDCLGAQVCTADAHCAGCRTGREPGRPLRLSGQPDIPVRRFGSAPVPLAEEELLDGPDGAPPPRTIGERGAIAVLAAGVLAACVAGFLLYA
jgi:hypothetical protein